MSFKPITNNLFTFSEVKKQTDEIINNTSGCKKLGEFTLSSGGNSDKYYDLYTLNQKKLETLSKLFWRNFGNFGNQYLLVPTMIGGFQFAYELSRKNPNSELLITRLNRKKYGTKNIIEGDIDAKNKKALIVEDVMSTGNSSLKYIKILEKLGIKVEGILTIVFIFKFHLTFEILKNYKIYAMTVDSNSD